MIFTDQIGNKISLEKTPMRIISTVPSQTELLYDLGLRDEVIGITKFCVHPDIWFRTKTRIGGTKKLNIGKIKSLKPDLIIGNKEENDEKQIKELMKHFPVWMADIKNLADALQMIFSIGEITNKKVQADEMCSEVNKRFGNFKSGIHNLQSASKRSAYFIWKNPYMCAGTRTFVDDMMVTCGFKNAVATERYPEITNEEIQKANPEIIFLSSEPYPFREKHIEEFKQICPSSKVFLVDGELFSWYGSRLLKAPQYFSELLKHIHSA